MNPWDDETIEELFVDLEEAIEKAMESHEPDIHSINNALEEIKDRLKANIACTNTYHSKEGYDCCN